MGSEDRAALPIHRRCGSMRNPIFSTPTSAMHRRCIGDASATRRDPPTSSTPTPSRRPLF
eukprot:2317271-Pyramimonas_sp.AAC.1